MVRLTVVFRVIVNRSYKKSYNTTFIRNIKTVKKKINFFFFSCKKFLKLFLKSILLKHPLTFSIKKTN